MVVYSDAAGNKYLGDCRWGNHDINYPTTNYLLSRGKDNMSSDLSSALSAAGITSFDVAAQSIFDSATIPARTHWLRFTPADDTSANTTTKRFMFGLSPSGLEHTIRQVMYSNSGTELIVHATSSVRPIWANHTDPTPVVVGQIYRPRQYILCAASNFVSFIVNAYANGHPFVHFFMAGRLSDINTNFGFYTADDLRPCIMIADPSIDLSSTWVMRSHFVVSHKVPLQTGRAAYTIDCSDGQTPGAQWATDMWVYDNNATLGYPVIGRVPNMLLGVGNYTYLKPVKIQGSVFPDNGSPWYLPVGTFAGKTLLMRCYSSMT